MSTSSRKINRSTEQYDDIEILLFFRKNTKGSSFKNINVVTNISMDWLNTETIKSPPTLVIVPPPGKSRNFLLDIKYADFTVVQDIPNGYPEADCYIIPPYKPFMYASLYSHNMTTNIYALRGKLNYTRSISIISSNRNTYTHAHKDISFASRFSRKPL